MKLKGKAAIVTGGNRGIKALALALGVAREGADVALNWLSHRKKADAVVAEIREMGREAMAIQGDMGKIADIEDMVRKASEQYGKIDILVNNAAIYPAHMFLDKTEEEVNRVFAVNLKEPFLCTQCVAKDMVKRGGLNTLTKVVGAEPAIYGIRVNCMILGLSRTPGMMQ